MPGSGPNNLAQAWNGSGPSNFRACSGDSRCAASVWRRLRDDKWMDQYPKNYWVLQHKAAKLIGQKVGRAKAPCKP